MSILIHAEIDGERLDDDALLQESLLILVGGDETTRHVISGGMEALLRHPEQYALLRREPARVTVAVEEMLRWVTPIQNMNRTATRDLELCGETHPRRRQGAAALPRGQPRRVGVRRAAALRRHPPAQPARRLRRLRRPTSASAPASPASSCA